MSRRNQRSAPKAADTNETQAAPTVESPSPKARRTRRATSADSATQAPAGEEQPRRRRGRPRKEPGAPRTPLKKRTPRKKRRPDDVPMVTTGVRVDERLSPLLVELARRRGAEKFGEGMVAAMSDVACLAMQAYAARQGITLEDYGSVVRSRRSAETIESLSARKLWIRYPASWKAGLDELFRRSPTTMFAAEIWRTAIFEDARAAGIDVTGAVSAPSATSAADGAAA